MKKNIKEKKNKESLTEKYSKAGTDLYINLIDAVSDDEVRKSIYPSTKRFITNPTEDDPEAVRGMTCDGVGGDEDEYNGPIPLGYREIAPSQLPLKGVVGKCLKHFAARNFFLGDQINGWFRQSCFVSKACSMPGDDAVACGYEIVPRGTKDKKLIEGLMDKFNSEEFNLDETMREFECNKRAYGGAILVPCFEEDVDMSQPLCDYGQLKGKTFLGFTCIEPYYLNPVFKSGSRELNDPAYKHYMEPTYWDVYGGIQGGDTLVKVNRIHRTWCLFRRNVITSRIYQPMYKYLGPSVPQMIIERLYSAEVCANESSMLLRSKRSFCIEADVRKMTANPEYAKRFLQNCSANADNWGIRVLPRNSNAKQMDSMLSECMPLTTAQYGILCAEVEIPAPKFMMAQLTGFANSGNYEIKLYAQNVRKLTTNDLAPIIKYACKIEMATRGKFDMQFDVKFGDVDIPTITEQAEIAYEQARAEKFHAEAKAVGKMPNGQTEEGAKSAETHKSVMERQGKDIKKKK